jgi:colicin import membrane protein
VLSATGIAGGTATRNQQGGGADAGYAGKIRACIQPNVSFPTPVRSGNNNPTAQYRVQVNSAGLVTSTSLRRSSGIQAFDRAVENGIRRCSPFPKPPSGSYPSYIDVNYRMYD